MKKIIEPREDGSFYVKITDKGYFFSKFCKTQEEADRLCGNFMEAVDATNKAMDARLTKINNLEADITDLRGYQSMYKRGEWKGNYSPAQIKEIYKDAYASGRV